ncbi:MAG: hypothetical protein JSS82_12605 [Bacteroidetes bacterium]|nr:hypothetical protein [Bacteroidota bacterium]
MTSAVMIGGGGVDALLPALKQFMRDSNMPEDEYIYMSSADQRTSIFEPALKALQNEWGCAHPLRCVAVRCLQRQAYAAVVSTHPGHDRLRMAMVICNSNTPRGSPYFLVRKEDDGPVVSYATFTAFLSDKMSKDLIPHGQRFWQIVLVQEHNMPLWFGAGRPVYVSGGVRKEVEVDGLFIDPFTRTFIGMMQARLLLSDDLATMCSASGEQVDESDLDPRLALRAITVKSSDIDSSATDSTTSSLRFLVQEMPPQKMDVRIWRRVFDDFERCFVDSKKARQEVLDEL